MSRTESTKHVVEILAAVAVLAATGLGFVAKDATEAKAAAEETVVAVTGASEDLSDDVAKLREENTALAAEVRDLQAQLGATDAGVAGKREGPPAGTVLYAGRVLKVPTPLCEEHFLNLEQGTVALENSDALRNGITLVQENCGGDLEVYTPSLLSTETTQVGTLAACEAAVQAAPLQAVDLSDGLRVCFVGDEVAAHVTVLEESEEVTYKITAWARG